MSTARSVRRFFKTRLYTFSRLCLSAAGAVSFAGEMDALEFISLVQDTPELPASTGPTDIQYTAYK